MAVLAATLGLCIATGAGAQQSRTTNSRRLTALALETDGLGGYTLVDLNSWVRPGRVTSSDRSLSGFSGRLFLANLGEARVGLEVGRHRLFEYGARSIDSTAFDTVNIQSTYGGIAFRLPESRRFSFDIAMGLYKLPKSILAFRDNGLRFTTSLAVYYRVVSYRGVSLPVGARLSSIVDSRAAVLPVSLTGGLAIRPFRAARGR